MTRFLTPALAASDDARPTLDLAVLVGAAGWSRLPPAVRRRFGIGHGAATYAGTMEMRCSRVGRVFALLSRLFGSPLCGVSAAALPASVRVFDDGRGGMVWERHFRAQIVRSTKQLDVEGGLLERTDGGLGMGLRVFEQDGALVFESHRFLWLRGRLRVRVPALLTPGTCRVVHTDLGDGRFRFDLDMRHPLWGRTFHQSGVFADPAVDTEGSVR
jgi:hypothetical protein